MICDQSVSSLTCIGNKPLAVATRMAEAILVKKLKDQLNCPVCLETYTDPKQLQCHHIYCQKCLGRLVVQDQQGQPILTCPNCRQVTPVPANGVAGLQPAFQTNRLLDILKEHKKAKEGVLYCVDHQERELELYCEPCEQFICFYCTIAKHNGHKYNLVKDVLEKFKESIQARKLCTPALTIDGVKTPSGVAISRGEVVVTEWCGHCVSVFGLHGERLRSFGTRGSGQGQFDSPSGIAVDADGNIIVADYFNNRIQKFSTDGQFIAAVGTRGSSPLQFAGPMGVAVNKINNMVYVVDGGNACIRVLYSDLIFCSTFGKRGTGEGQFRHPSCVACDCSGTVYVADSYNHRIQVFTADGRFKRMFGGRGEGRGELKYPDGVAVNNDILYVTDGNHRVSVFTSRGHFVTSFGREGRGKGEFCSPVGVTADNGVVYVCDTYNNRVQIF